MESQIAQRLCGNETLCFPSQNKDRRGVRQESLQALPDPSREPGRRVSDHCPQRIFREAHKPLCRRGLLNT